jgi:acid phosphatase
MTNDAHDTNVTFAGEFLRGWLPHLLNNSYFMDETLMLITFDEADDYPIPNSKSS